MNSTVAILTSLQHISTKLLIATVFSVGPILLAVQAGHAQSDTGRLIHFGDLIDVDVVGSTEYDWRGGLTPEGFLDGLDQIAEKIPALCRTEAQVASAIAQEYSKILRDPQIVVRILDSSNRALARMDGAVRTPHRFRIQRPVRLIELIVAAGGITDVASGEILIQRPLGLSCTETSAEPDKAIPPTGVRIKIADLLKGDQAANLPILSGDLITILEAYPVYVIGGVERPGSINSRDSLSLSRAISISGGFSNGSDEERITIYRRVEGASSVIQVNFKDIDSEKLEDPILKPFDVVDVRQKGRGERKFPPDPEQVGRQIRDRDRRSPLKIID